MEMKIENIRSFRIAFRRQTGPYGYDNGEFMNSFKTWVFSRDLTGSDPVIFGIARDNPETTASENCRYDACLVVGEDFSGPGGDIHMGEITGGRYAVFKISHTPESVQKAWKDLFPALSKGGQEWDVSKPVLERYTRPMLEKHFCELLVPLKQE